MTVYFMDSRAIAKHYEKETGSAWVSDLVRQTAGHVIVISQLALVEVCSVLARKQRLSQINPADAIQRKADFLLDVDQIYLAVSLDETVLTRAGDLVSRYPL